MPRVDVGLAGMLMILLLAGAAGADNGFKPEQLRYSRVRTAFSETESSVQALFAKKGLAFPPSRIFLRVFKWEGQLELWAQDSPREPYKLVTRYAICSASGKLGPKRRQGDLQVPEGFYIIDRFNPVSSYYLSLGLDYPNRSDRILGESGNLGGDIFIHGSCVTIGCIPITTPLVKELYVVAVEARAAGQTKIPVHIFPTRLDEQGLKRLENSTSNKPLLEFWRNLEPGFSFFERSHRIPRIRVSRSGRYLLKD